MPESSPLPSLTALTTYLAEGHPEPYASLRRDLLTVLDAGLGAVQPGPLLEEAFEEGMLTVNGERYDLGHGEGLHVLVVGRGSEPFARKAGELLPRAEGLVIAPRPGKVGNWDWIVGEHPVPGEGSVRAGKAALEFVQAVGADERLLVLLTGGASALMEVPEVPLEDLQMTTQTLLSKGLTVHEMNLLRKHLSQVKGGQLANACPGEVLTLAISDVPHDRPSDLGSGPTVADPTTFKQAYALVQRVGEENFPPVVVEHLQQGVDGTIEDTPKPGADDVDTVFGLLATNEDALEAAAEMANELDHRVTILPSPMEGEARVVGESLARRVASEGDALLAGGETTVTLRPSHQGGPGEGGRNQELTLAAALNLAGEPVVAAGFGTDGIDGPTNAAGAIADGRTLERAQAKGLDPEEHLDQNNSNAFFDALGDLIVTGPTGTNVMDLFVALVAQA